MLKVLLIGFADCEYCNEASRFLQEKKYDVTTYWAPKTRGGKLPEEISAWTGDFIFNLKCYQIFKKSFLDSAVHGAINFHPSSPKYPGSGGTNWALYNDDDYTGVTVHYMNEHVDNGKIINFYEVKIEKTDGVRSLLKKVHKRQLDAFKDIIGKISSGGLDVVRKMQSEYSEIPWANRTGKIKEINELGTIDCNIEKERLDKVIRATSFGNFGPKINIHGHTFKFIGED